jgi:2-polyprenyl-6-methoxyphenol hydroxylase-like FAD-dependent oxidoreductase
MKRYRVGIAGSGPAGLATAVLLHRQGHDVTIFERFSVPRPVGSGLMLQPTGLAVLDQLGLAKATVAAGTPIHRLAGRCARTGRKVLDVRYEWLGKDAGFGLGIHRAGLFGVLHEAAVRDGIEILPGREITGSRWDRDGRVLEFKDGRKKGAFDLVVDAAGVRSALTPPNSRTLRFGALWATVDWPDGAGFDPHALEQRYIHADVMVGLMPTGTLVAGRPLGTFFWSMKADALTSWKECIFGDWIARVSVVWPELKPVLEQLKTHDQLAFASYAHRTLTTPVEPHLYHLGDAWHSTSPQLGQGANMALIDAYALSVAIENEPDLPAALSHARRLRQFHIRLYQALSQTLTPFYQSDSRILPMIRDLLVPHVARHWPATWIQAAMLSGLLGNPLARLQLSPYRSSQ